MFSLKKIAWMFIHPIYAFEEIKAGILINRSEVKITDIPWLDAVDLDFICSVIRPSQAIIEYGAGSSTLFFAQRVKKIHSVDSSRHYIEGVLSEANKRGLENINLVFADIGMVGAWGRPIDRYPTSSNTTKWRAYVESPWADLGEEKIGLVMIDGRFRAAAAAYSIAQLIERSEDQAVIFLDDFLGREEEYGVLREIAELIPTGGRGVIVKPFVTDSLLVRKCFERWIVDVT